MLLLLLMLGGRYLCRLMVYWEVSVSRKEEIFLGGGKMSNIFCVGLRTIWKVRSTSLRPSIRTFHAVSNRDTLTWALQSIFPRYAVLSSAFVLGNLLKLTPTSNILKQAFC